MTNTNNQEEPTAEIYESISVKYEDINITISSLPDGTLYNKSQEEVLKFCADILLSMTDESTLESKIEIPIAIQETLEKDFGWDKNKIFDFLRKLRHRLFLMNIGEYTKEEREAMLKEERENRAKRKLEEDLGVSEKDNPVIISENNVVTVLPKQQNFSDEDKDYPTQFVTSDAQAAAIQPQQKKPSSKEKK